jgi:hypothetical protein
VQIAKKSILARVNKKHNVPIDSFASSGGQGKYVKYVSFSWSPPEAAVPVLNVSPPFKKLKQFFIRS